MAGWTAQERGLLRIGAVAYGRPRHLLSPFLIISALVALISLKIIDGVSRTGQRGAVIGI